MFFYYYYLECGYDVIRLQCSIDTCLRLPVAPLDQEQDGAHDEDGRGGGGGHDHQDQQIQVEASGWELDNAGVILVKSKEDCVCSTSCCCVGMNVCLFLCLSHFLVIA